jgi:hypothetical protein|nr:MAG TPA: hypothetical protein [Caudoviricetes sp.]
MTEDEIREKIKKLEIRMEEYLEIGNTKRANIISNEIRKWEELLYKIDGSLEKRISKLEKFIKSKDLWKSYLNF